MTKTIRSAWVGVIYLLAGIYLVFSLVFYPFAGNFFNPPTPGSSFFYALGGIGVIGLFVLILPRIRSSAV